MFTLESVRTKSHHWTLKGRTHNEDSTATDRSAVSFSLSGGEVHDSLESIALLDRIVRSPEQNYILMDRAYEGENTRKKTQEFLAQVVWADAVKRKF